MNKYTRLKSNLFCLTAAIIWGFAFVAQGTASKLNTDTFLILSVRYFLGALSLLPIIILFENKNEKKVDQKPKFKTTLIGGVICGTVLFLASFLQQWGILINPNASGRAGFITGLYTVLVPIFCFVLFKKKTGINVILGAVCAVVGLYLLSDQGRFGKADLLLFAGTVFWTFHIITIDRFINRVSAVKFSAIQFLTCSVISFIALVIAGQIDLSMAIEQIKASWQSLLYLGIFSSGIGYTCQVLGQKGADPTYASIILSTESVFAAIGGILFGNEKMELLTYMGFGIIFIGIILSQLDFGAIKIKRNSQ